MALGGNSKLSTTTLTTSVTSDYTLLSTDKVIEYDCTSGNIVVTEPVITNSFKNQGKILHVRIDTSSNTLTFKGTGGNSQNDNFQLGNDPQLQSVETYASNSGIWRRVGYGLPEQQQAYYKNLSSGLITSGLLGDDPNQLFTDNGDGTIDINFGGEFRIVDRVNEDNTTPVLNNRFFKYRSRIVQWAAESNKTSGSDGEFWIIVDNSGAISITLSTTGSLLLPIFTTDGSPNLNTHLQLGGMVKTAGTINSLAPNPVVDNNIGNVTRHIAQNGIGVVNSNERPIEITPISGTIQLALNAGITFTGAAGEWIKSGGLATNFFETVATSPVSIFLVDRAGDGNIISITTSANDTEYESTPGTFTAIGSSKAANRFYQAAESFITELLGQKTYSGGSRLTDAEADDEPLDIPGLTTLLPKVVKMSVDSGSTDLSLIAQAIFKLINQFR